MTSIELTEILTFLGLDLAEAAQLLGVSTRTLRRWMEGEEIPGPAQAALRAWHQLHARHLAWKPDAISIFENDQAQLERARLHAREVSGLIKAVEARGGPQNPWSVNIAKGVATFGPFEIGFYNLQNGSFSLSGYRRKDSSPDLVRDRPYLEDAAYSISMAFSKAGESEIALDNVAEYVRKHSAAFVVDGPQRLSPADSKRRQRDIELLAGKIDELAKLAAKGSANHLQFEELLHQLHELGFFPTIDLVSAVAKAMV
ncbi:MULTISPECIES: helix-turn-helix domain-containing protein [Bradyrhizobium]|uniref:DNA-binding protein n=3 Tax=Bradyrhizobium TaxID=374 RepID=A0AAE6CCW6_9BRAD|nr:MULTISPECIES: helix-turn-helix domain-containing protein [Bradyrhizobium]MCG2629438.1 helix-turn-helix domain-containing protein [Bradyrhizobium zhengyangense]MCG2644935.1 helix-turn-helix domain-containing protein [Bradyrhizobium zhengyangense]MCG2670952.1 helix-turn-helix domain-containing protein [Bradyrhizobium zhengyangense]MDN4984585.1 helix-turn-helix domain-containing protein [Bradyrhizobium sp. WYCCWR 13022]MDN5002578.1 helix-turn-helix domain-containing protein [Bradyrhizobium sp.